MKWPREESEEQMIWGFSWLRYSTSIDTTTLPELEPGGAPPNVPSRIEETISIRCLPTSQHPFYRAHDILGYYLDYLPTPYVDP
jgi:hypothetical protein